MLWDTALGLPGDPHSAVHSSSSRCQDTARPIHSSPESGPNPFPPPLLSESPSCSCNPQFYLLHPPLQGLWFQEKANFTCLVVGEDLVDARLSWEVAGKVTTNDVEQQSLERLANGSQSQSSHLVLPRSTWEGGSNVSCILTLPCLASPRELTAAKEQGAQAPSSLSVSLLTTPAPLETALWLLCEVSGFSPHHVLLMWLEGQKEVGPERFASAEPGPQSRSTMFRTWSTLRIPHLLSPSPATYTCVVKHEASRTMANASSSLGARELATTLLLAPQSQDQNSDDYTELDKESSLWTMLGTFVALFLLTLLYSGFVTFIKVK